MNYAARLAELERKCRQNGLTPDEMREANALRSRLRRNDRRNKRYRDDPEYRRSEIKRAGIVRLNRREAMA